MRAVEPMEGTKPRLTYTAKLRLCAPDPFFGPGVAELMERVDKSGSLSEACREMGMAYSKGWKMLRKTGEVLGFAVVQGIRGGKTGGRMVLTEEGRAFLLRYRRFEAEVRGAADGLFSQYFEGDSR